MLKAKTNDATKLALIGDFDQVLSLSLLEKAEAKRVEDAKAKVSADHRGYTVTGEGDPEVDALVMQRYEAKKAKNFAEADRIRDELKAGASRSSIPRAVLPGSGCKNQKRSGSWPLRFLLDNVCQFG